ncbi:hypothetical protein NUW58_g9271 [Xylaria curta]|uniref:Uncharacterized protein n=1 Tax=Xylaria curta TaxID=42375 RepID=A0ACC1MZE8_9PEZI|nr:hypothetical protein NUW58_g9271 [Xylaria curta]
MASMTARLNNNQYPFQPAVVGPIPMPRWQHGDIAFLKRADQFSQVERAEFLDSRRIQVGATGHPVIILDRSNDLRYYLITAVSAYSSSEFNNYLPPWKQSAHRRKNVNGFRAFEGSAKPNNKHQHLRLADDKQWPKVEASWVYIYRPYVVPASTLISYTKSKSQLHMEPESLQDLLGHMKAKSWRFRKQKKEISTRVAPKPAARKYLTNWRTNDKE